MPAVRSRDVGYDDADVPQFCLICDGLPRLSVLVWKGGGGGGGGEEAAVVRLTCSVATKIAQLSSFVVFGAKVPWKGGCWLGTESRVTGE